MPDQLHTERYLTWHSLADIPDQLSCEAIYDDWEGMRIILAARDPLLPRLRIAFDRPLAYRNIDEGKRIKTLPMVEGVQGPLAIVENSPWLEWLAKESAGIVTTDEARHYAVLTVDDWIDVICATPPRVEWLGKSRQA